MKAIEWLEMLVERFFAVFLVLLFAPYMVAAGICIILSSPGPAFVRERWTTRAGQQIEVFRFRTRTLAGRWTLVGRFLYRHNVVEFPILLNVIRGQLGLKEFIECFKRHWSQC